MKGKRRRKSAEERVHSTSADVGDKSGKRNKRVKSSKDGKVKSGQVAPSDAGKKKEKKVHFTSLPTELFDIILAQCSKRDLLVLSCTSKDLYMITIPALYRDFRPSHWMEVAKLGRLLVKGMGPISLNRSAVTTSVGIQIRSITVQLGQLFAESEVDGKGVTDKTSAWLVQHTYDCLVDIIEKAGNLHSFKCHDLLQDGRSEALWEALGKTPLKELDVSKNSSRRQRAHLADYNPFHSRSKLWTIRHLVKLHISSNGCSDRFKADEMGSSSLLEVLESCPDLQDFKVAVQACTKWPKSAFKTLEKLSSLRKLALQGIGVEGEDQQIDVLELLDALPRLESLRIILQSDRRTVTSPTAETRLRRKVHHLALKEVELSNQHQLIDILRHCQPRVVRNVSFAVSMCDPDDMQGADDNEGVALLEAALKGCHKIKEMTLLIYRYNQEDLVRSMLKAVPSSVERLAIHMPLLTDYGAMDYTALTKIHLRSLDHLKNLKRLILPWEAILHKAEDMGEDEEKLLVDIDAKAGEIIGILDNSMLEYVFFQGSIDMRSGSPKAAPRFGEYEDFGKRFTVQITRTPNSKKKMKRKSRSLVETGNSTLGNVKNGSLIQVEVIGASCICSKCYMEEDLDVEKRYCNEDNRV